MSRNKLLLLIAVLASVAVAAGGFFLGVQPQLSKARANDAQRTSVESANAAAQAQIAALTKQNQTLDQQKAELAALQGSIPSTLNESSFYTELNQLAGSAGVTISSITTSEATAYTPPVSTTPAASTSGTASASPSATATPTPSASPSTPAAPAATTNSLITSSNFTAVPVSVGVDGSFPQALSFLKSVQSGSRLFLVNNITSTSGASADSSSSSGDTSASSPMTWTLSGYIYVLEDAASTKAEQSQADSSSSDAATTSGSSASRSTTNG
jgi:Tfp pilus assembly protein PilO